MRQRRAASSQPAARDLVLEAEVRPRAEVVARSRGGSARSPAAASSGASSRGWARTRTSRGATATSQAQPGIGVVAPGAADVGRALEDHEVVDALLLQADGGAEPAEAAADDGDVGVHVRETTDRSGRHPSPGLSSRAGAYRPLARTRLASQQLPDRV